MNLYSPLSLLHVLKEYKSYIILKLLYPKELYLALYSRWPSDEEKRIALESLEVGSPKRQQAVEDLIWALINSAEFVFNH